MHTVSYAPRKTSHGFHLIMTLCTAGCWLPIWGMCALFSACFRKKIKSYTKPQPNPVYYAPHYYAPVVQQHTQYTPRHSAHVAQYAQNGQ